jgi:glycosyltransferase involved in cell wall biosynthesis
MRIVQIIDSLENGGAERMAVNYANALSTEIEFSGLVATRAEGNLKNQINDNVIYLFLNKKRSIDLKALSTLRRFIKNHKIEVIHAHGTSYFFSVLLKYIYPKVKIVWHDHYGNRISADSDNKKLKFFSRFFSIVFTVNRDLEKWAKKNLECPIINYLPNFYSKSNTNKITFLKGENQKRIVCVANLKDPKNHLFLLSAFNKSDIAKSGYSLHLIGNDYLDDYSKQLKKFIVDNNLSKSIFIYGSCSDIDFILSQANIGVLCSTSEGFPVSILEYGNAKLTVIATNVGEISSIIQHQENGYLIDSNHLEQFVNILQRVAENKENIQEKTALKLYESIEKKYSEKAVINQYLTSLSYICNIDKK